jgi:pyridoxine/pyridoxamine 5'-phosphate oxidase
MDDPAGSARQIVDSNVYMTLATADADGRPWPSPVWFAHEGYARFVWVSKPDARHSRNLAVRAETGIVIFDSSARQGAAQAVYLDAIATRVAEDEEERWTRVFSARSQALGWPAWGVEDVRAPAAHRLYRADATAQFVLGENDERIEVALG